MELKGLNIGFVLTGAFPMLQTTIPKIKDLIREEATVIPIMSNAVYSTDTKYGKAKNFITEIQEITGKEVIHTIKGLEPLGKKDLIDLMIIAPCTRKYYIKTCDRHYR